MQTGCRLGQRQAKASSPRLQGSAHLPSVPARLAPEAGSNARLCLEQLLSLSAILLVVGAALGGVERSHVDARVLVEERVAVERLDGLGRAARRHQQDREQGRQLQPRGARQPAALASSSEQNMRSPARSLMTVRA